MIRATTALFTMALLAVTTAGLAADPAPAAKPSEASQAGRVPPPPRKAGVNATASIQASGTYVRTGEKSAFFAGAFAGTLDVQDPPGDAAPLDGAGLLCPGIVLIDLSNRFQEAEGRCTLTTKGGDQVYADFECGGSAEKGCRGSLEISGGSGALAGIDGGGTFAIQGGVADAAVESLGKRVEDVSAGEVRWSGVSLTMP